jgi:hypothetical protein
MPSMGFEPMIPASERAKAVHALDRAVTVTREIQYAVVTNYTANSDRRTTKQSMSQYHNNEELYRKDINGVELRSAG